jgi:hypothetical protein
MHEALLLLGLAVAMALWALTLPGGNRPRK